MNALKTGIDANSLIIQHESAGRLEALADEYHDRFHPTTPEQRMLVDTLVDSEWLLRRFRRVEAQLWQQGFPNATTVSSTSTSPSPSAKPATSSPASSAAST
jgi:hypothetical protein